MSFWKHKFFYSQKRNKELKEIVKKITEDMSAKITKDMLGAHPSYNRFGYGGGIYAMDHAKKDQADKTAISFRNYIAKNISMKGKP